jgi:ATPase subunit of ABC transporter with duplicated ATPase domains
VHIEGRLAYVPQTTVCGAETTVAALLGCEERLAALERILQGSLQESDFHILNEDWQIKERLRKHLAVFGLEELPLERSLAQLSGGEVTRLLLSQVFASDADFLLLDEPSNHLDAEAREQLYEAIRAWRGGLIVASHDRRLLEHLEEIIELSSLGAAAYGGNYSFYAEQKQLEKAAREQEVQDAKKQLQRAHRTIQHSREKHEQKQAYGRALRDSGSIDKMAAGSAKGRSERTQSKMLIKEERLLNQAQTLLKTAKDKIEFNEELQFELPATRVPQGKRILDLEAVSFSYEPESPPVLKDFHLIVQGPERLALAGKNGSGKTTLVKVILGELVPQRGRVHCGTCHLSYLDQNASLLQPELSILKNFQRINPEANENEAYRSLAAFAFRNAAALRLVKDLSGGEKLRALLACVLLAKQPPQLLILDEPTNHLDLHSLEVIEAALKKYQGALLVISHDQRFLTELGIERIIQAPFISIPSYR